MQLNKSGIPLIIGIQNPSFTEKELSPVVGIRIPRRAIQIPRLSWTPSRGQRGVILLFNICYFFFYLDLEKDLDLEKKDILNECNY